MRQRLLCGAAVFALLLLATAQTVCGQSREKRFVPLLTFPRTSPTRVQIITGIGIPVALNFESVTIGYVFKAEYFLPENASNVLGLLSDPFDPTPQPLSGTGRKRRHSRQAIDTTPTELHGYDADQRQHFEKYEAEAVEVESGTNEAGLTAYDDEDDYRFEADENDDEIDDLAEELPAAYTLNDVKIKEPNNLSTARFTLYRGLENLVQKRGLPGRPCMLRSICEASAAQFSYHNGILGELAHIIMSPSTSPDQIIEHSDGEYLHAELMGRRGEPCEQVFRECPVSVLEKFSGLYNTMGGLMNMLG